MKNAIEIAGVSKKYLIQHKRDARESFAESINNKIISKIKKQKITYSEEEEIFWALKNISLEVKKGEKLGIIGNNGAGKSTLLKILSRITSPTEGKIGINGKIASLLEVGTGFHPELTGRENIYLNGAILGMSRKQIASRFEEIVEFSAVEKFLDTPVKRYSSGMYVRLAFSVAAHLDSDILIVDEVLAVGDVNFQKKCLSKLDSAADDRRTVLFVSHNMSSIRRLCDTAVILRNGQVEYQGGVEEAIIAYNREPFNGERKKIKFSLDSNIGCITSVELDSQDINGVNYEYSKEITFKVTLSIYQNMNCFLGIEIIDQNGQIILFWRDFELMKSQSMNKQKGSYLYSISIPMYTLSPGNYKIGLALVDYDSKKVLHRPEECLVFKVIDTSSIRASLGIPWRGVSGIPLNLSIAKI